MEENSKAAGPQILDPALLGQIGGGVDTDGPHGGWTSDGPHGGWTTASGTGDGPHGGWTSDLGGPRVGG